MPACHPNTKPNTECMHAQAEEAADYLNFLSGLPHRSTVVKGGRQPLLPPQAPGNWRR